MELEKRIGEVSAQKKEIAEAMTAGRSVLSVMKNITSSLNSAESFGVWDVMGGGIFADMGKYSHLDRAQEQIERLQLALRKFRTELADVKMNADIQISIDSFMRFADYAFDNIFTDWAVMDKIQKAQEQVARKQHQVEEIIEKLRGMSDNLDIEKECLRKTIEEKAMQISMK